MELSSPDNPKLITMMPTRKPTEEVHTIKRKSPTKMNVSDFLDEKKKRISKKLSQHFGSDLLDFNSSSKKNKEPKYGRRASFTLKPKIKKELLKEYKQQLRMEKKYRKLVITQNLFDSSFEESGEENDDVGLEIYISSESYFILVFDIFITFFTFYLLFCIPLRLAERKNYYTEQSKIFVVFNIITEVLYILDFILCFFRTYHDYQYQKITDIYNIIMNYITNDFLLDLIEAIPSYIICKNYCYENVGFNAELSGFEIIMTILQMVKSLKILKVLGAGGNRAVEILHEKIAENFFFENVFNIFTFVFKIFSFLHILICIHIFLGWQSYPNWMIHINIIDEALIIKYISSFYFIIETMTTVGYGDIICISSVERFFQLILLSIGIVSYSFIISKFTNYVMKQSKEEIELDKKMNELEQIRIQYPLIPYKLYMKIQTYFRKKSEKKNNKNEMTNLVNNLPDKLRNDMLLVIYRDAINKFYIFKGCNNTDFITQMCAAFIQTTVDKETILMPEGKKVENIIFVKEGRLILEAVINLTNPSESYEKYFRENFKSINAKAFQNMRNSVSYTNSQIDYKQIENNNYLSYLEERLMESNKIGTKGNSFFDVTRNSVSFQIGEESEEEQEQERSATAALKEKEGANYQHLKILDVRKNEHFGDCLLFLEKPAPLTLKVKSKKAVIFILKKKDAKNINNIHHNIMDRIREKSLRNLIALKHKTIDILKQYIGNKLNKIKRTQLQNASWFNEKSRNNILHDITNFLNNSLNIIEKGELSPNSPLNANATPFRRNIVQDIINARASKISNNKEYKTTKTNRTNTSFKGYKGLLTINTPSNNQIRKKIGGFRKSNETEFHSISSKNNYLHLNYEPKLKFKNKHQNKSFSLITKPESGKLKIDKLPQSHNNIKYRSGFSKKSVVNLNPEGKDKKRVKFKVDLQENESVSKEFIAGTGTLEVSSSEDPSPSPSPSEATQGEEKTTSLNDVITEADSEVRKKIKSSVERQKILKLCRIQTKMIELYQKKMNEKPKPNNKSFDMKEDDELKKISDLNNIIYKKLLEYLDAEEDTEIVGEKIMGRNYRSEKVISFSIKSSYSNLNNLTKGKIIINNNYKIDIKNLIQNYIKEKNKNSMNSLDYLVKNYYNQNQDIDQITFHNVSPKSPKSPRRKRVKFQINRSSKNLNNKLEKDRIPTKILSHQIKKTITNKIEQYKNFKSMDIDDNFSNIKNKKEKTKTITNSSSKLNIDIENNSYQKTNSNSGNGFTRFINSIYMKYMKLKGK